MSKVSVPLHKDMLGFQREVFGCVLLTAFIVICRVRLSKRRAKAGAQSTTNAVLVCKHRDMNEKELEAQVSVTFPFCFCCIDITLNSFTTS